MKKKLFLLLIIATFMTHCLNQELNVKKDNSLSSQHSSSYKAAKKTIKLKIDLEEQRKLQAEVDKGHQPWRLKPIDVALSFLVTIDKSIDYNSCTLNNMSYNEADVICKTNKKYTVHLKKLVKADGIWTVISIDIEEEKK